MSSALSPASVSDPVRYLLSRWREDPGGTYQTWFLWEERLKNFRSIRRGALYDLRAPALSAKLQCVVVNMTAQLYSISSASSV